ncbi:dihydrodipicolinate synthase family protein [Streptomyces sp. 6N223]|uniref:dihydrodipicolinate synthase family protein n=1 Tax=Streptomyces sp. 6N223 TaxID=3457412 RepID=UPI003FD04F97
MTLPARLGGVIPPVCTPLNPDGEVDDRSLIRLVDHLRDAEVDGLFVLGSTSEAAFLTDRQRRTVVETVAGHLGGALPLLAGAIDMTTPRVLDHAREALAAGADAIVATAPFYAPTGPAETERHFRLLAERTGAPLLAYDLPSAVHTKLAPELVLRLAADGVLAGLKDSSPDQIGLRRVITAARAHHGIRDRDFAVFTGSENTVDTALLMGADGVVPGLGNVDPHGFVRLVRLCAAGDWERARAEQERLLALFAMVRGRPSAIGAFKAALRLRGVIAHATTAEPQRPLTDADVEEVAKHLATAGLL